MFNNPQGFTNDDQGNLFVADTNNHTIRMISPEGNVQTLAGTAGTHGFRDGEDALFYLPRGIAWNNGVLYIADTGNHRIRAISDGLVTTIAGSDTGLTDEDGNTAGDFRDGAALTAMFNNPMDVVVASDGTIYVADTGNGMVRVIKDDIVSTVAGLGTVDTNEIISQRVLIAPRGLYLADNYLYIADMFLNSIIQLKVGR
jgi:DNA-binding beta-propeller fold protein YncE